MHVWLDVADNITVNLVLDTSFIDIYIQSIFSVDRKLVA